jgi:hypothetical protein
VRPKLLPHRLSFDCGSKRPSHPAMIDVQSSATFLAAGSSQLKTDKDSNLFKTTLEDRHSSYNTASINADMLDGHDKDKSDTLQAIPPKLLSHPAYVYAQLSASPACTTHLDDKDKDNYSNYNNLSLLPPTKYLQAFKQLKSQDRAKSKCRLEQINKFSDYVLRTDAVRFIHSLHYQCGQHSLWYRPSLGNPITGLLEERTLRSLQCAKTTEEDTIIGPVRLRMARIFLYYYMEQKVLYIRTNRSMPHLRA